MFLIANTFAICFNKDYLLTYLLTTTTTTAITTTITTTQFLLNCPIFNGYYDLGWLPHIPRETFQARHAGKMCFLLSNHQCQSTTSPKLLEHKQGHINFSGPQLSMHY